MGSAKKIGRGDRPRRSAEAIGQDCPMGSSKKIGQRDRPRASAKVIGQEKRIGRGRPRGNQPAETRAGLRLHPNLTRYRALFSLSLLPAYTIRFEILSLTSEGLLSMRSTVWSSTRKMETLYRRRWSLSTKAGTGDGKARGSEQAQGCIVTRAPRP